MRNPTTAERILDFLANNPGRHPTSKIAEAIDACKNGTSSALSKLARNDEIIRIQQGIYRGKDENAAITQTRFTAAREHLYSEERSAKDNEQTINKLLNAYDEVFALFQVWLLNNMVSQEIDFEKQLLFLENFKWLTMIADKLMKRWSLVHVGYDTNTRQAQEDAKAKTEAREKEALKDAPLEDKIVVVGKYDPEAMKLIDCIPSSVENLENMTDEEAENIKV